MSLRKNISRLVATSALERRLEYQLETIAGLISARVGKVLVIYTCELGFSSIRIPIRTEWAGHPQGKPEAEGRIVSTGVHQQLFCLTAETDHPSGLTICYFFSPLSTTTPATIRMMPT